MIVEQSKDDSQDKDCRRSIMQKGDAHLVKYIL